MIFGAKMWINALLSLVTVLSTLDGSVGNVLRQKSHHDHYIAPSGRIIGGKEADVNTAKYMVGILLYPSIGNVSFCGGTLVSKQFVLTAAHCLIGMERGILMFGVHKWTDRNEENRVEINVEKDNFIIHGEADIPKHIHDIGLIKLPYWMQENDFIKIVTLPTFEDAKKDYVAKIGRAYGWGLTHDVNDPQVSDISEVLMYVDVAVIGEPECRNSYPYLNEGTMCTSGHGIKATCSGDSGGPYLVNNTLIALTAYGKRKCEQDVPSVYTDVFYYMNWIEENSDVEFKSR